MDEPTSSMDAQSETMFLKQLKAAVGSRTMVLITHRPAALDLVDRIVVIDNGKVLIDGPKPQVLAALSGAPVPPTGAQQPRPPAAASAPRGVPA
jgi:ATP-binding cassette, subfamily C, bacterial LapB